MANLILNHQKVQEKMERRNLRTVDIGRMLGLSRQLAHYVVHNGGAKYSLRLAEIFNCPESELLMVSMQKGRVSCLRMPKGMVIIDGKVKDGRRGK
jgi:hypothetical protein